MAGQQNKTTLVVVAAVFFSAGIGFVMGRLSVDSGGNVVDEARDSEASSSTNPNPRRSRSSGVDLEESPRGERRRRSRGMPSSRWAQAWRNQARLNKEQSDKNRAKTPLNEALRAAREAEHSPDSEEAQSGAREAAVGLYYKLTTDQTALAGAIQRMPNLTDRGEIGMMAAVLGRIRDPEVESLAIEMTKSPSALVREGAFDILDGLDSPGARAVALRALANETEPGIRRAAVRAIPDSSGASIEEAGETVRQLGEVLSRDQDPETRRLAAISLASWHRDLSEFMPVLKAMRRDTSATVRAGCAFACEIAGRKESQIVAALVQVLELKEEDSVVRDNAYRALKVMGPMSPASSAVFKNYEREMDERGAGEGSDY